MSRQALTKKASLLWVLPFLTAITVISFHHHSDFSADSDCIICKVAKALASNDTPTIIHIPLPQIYQKYSNPKKQLFTRFLLMCPIKPALLQLKNSKMSWQQSIPCRHSIWLTRLNKSSLILAFLIEQARTNILFLEKNAKS